MMRCIRYFAFFALATLGLVPGARADAYSEHRDLFTPGYFLDELKFDGDTHRYYHDYALEKSYGVTPNISPYAATAISILNWTNYNSITFTVRDAGRYVDSWNFYRHGDQTSLKKFVSGAPKSLAVTYSMVAGVSGLSDSVDVIPLLKMITYTLAYDAQGGEWVREQPSETEYIWSNKIVVAASDVVSREGYAFQNWNTVSTGTGTVLSPGETCWGGQKLGIDAGSVDADGKTNITLYAQWKAKPYPLNLKVGTGIAKIVYCVDAASSPRQWVETATNLTVSVDYDDTWAAYAVAKPGYKYTDTSAEKPTTAKMTTAGATFDTGDKATAQPIVVSFDGNGKTSGTMSDQSFAYDVGARLNENQYVRSYSVKFNVHGGAAADAETSVYAFAGWNSAADGAGAFSYADHQMVTNPCASTGEPVTLYAQWNSAAAAVTLPETSREGYAFLGWSEAASLSEAGSGHVYRAGDLYLPTADVTLHAQWEKRKYTVVFRDGADGYDNAPIVKILSAFYGEVIDLPTASAHDAKKFTGWSSVDTETLVVKGDLTTYTEYECVSYHVVYHSNYGNRGTEKSVLSDYCGPYSGHQDYLKLLDVGASDLQFSKAGYKFLGWSWSADATNAEYAAGTTLAYNVISERSEGQPTLDVSADLYAVWEPLAYSIIYLPGFDLAYSEDYQGGATNQTLRFDRPANLLANPYRLDGQRFLGWRDAKGRVYEDQAIVSNLTETVDDVLTMTALWDGDGDRYVAFEPGTNGTARISGTMAVQRFGGTNEQYLASNRFVRLGYGFKGWATNSTDAASRRAAYSDRASYSFGPTALRHATNTLYAVWEPIAYTLIFNTGTNDVTGTLQPQKCEYSDSPAIELPNCHSAHFDSYTNYCTGGFVGWSASIGGPIVADGTDMAKSCVLHTNLATSANDCVTLYATWEELSLSELSETVGLTNAVLVSDEGNIGGGAWSKLWVPAKQSDKEWDVGHVDRIKIFKPTQEVTVEPTKYNLRMKVRGSGTVSFDWCCFHMQNCNGYEIRIDNQDVKKLLDSNTQVRYWTNTVVEVVGDGEHEISWRWNGDITSDDLIALDNVRWMPDVVWNWPSYGLKYEGFPEAGRVQDEDAAGRLAYETLTNVLTSYAATNATFTFPAITNAAGQPWRYVDASGVTNVFAGWMPAKVVRNTTGDLTVRALWTKVSPKAEVSFALGEGLDWGTAAEGAADGEFVRADAAARSRVYRYAVGEDVRKLPEVVVSNGYDFAGWEPADAPSRRVPSEGLALSAVSKRLPEPVSPSEVSNRVWHTVTFALGDHLGRTGGGALVQLVEDGQSVTNLPKVQVDEGYVFGGWGTIPEKIFADAMFTAVVTNRDCALTVRGADGSVRVCKYGTTFAANAPFDAETVGGTNIVCTGWIGSGSVPASGTGTNVSFLVTGDGAVDWVYETNYWVCVTEEETVPRGGTVSVYDSKGKAVTNEGWFAAGSRLAAVATPADGWRFKAWQSADALEENGQETLEFFVDGARTLTAVFEEIPAPTHTVSFVLDDHLTRTGGGELEQSVKEGAAIYAAPQVVSGEGWLFADWRDAAGRRMTGGTGGEPLRYEDEEGSHVYLVTGDATFTGLATQCQYVVRFVLDDHLARTGGGELLQTVTHGGSATLPTVKSDSTSSFAGWFDEFGETVVAKDLHSVTDDRIVYGRAQKSLMSVSVNVAAGCEAMGTVSGGKTAKPGTKVTVSAKAKTGFVLSGWYDGGELISQSTSYSFVVSDDVSLVAKFIAKSDDWAYVSCDGLRAEYERGAAIEPVPVTAAGGSLPTVKVTGLPTGLKFTTKLVTAKVTTGSGTSRVTTLVTNALPNTIYGTPTKSGAYTIVVSATTAGKATASKSYSVVVRAAGEHVVTAEVCEGTGAAASAAGKVTGIGVNAKGKKVTLRATANKGYVFKGWYENDRQLSTVVSYAFVMPDDDVTLQARFLTLATEKSSVEASVAGMAVISEGQGGDSAPATNISVGVYLEWPVVASAETAVTVAVSGLPSGLKFATKPVVTKTTTGSGKSRVTTVVTNVPANTIYGVPTAGGKTSAVKVTVTTAGKQKVVGAMNVTVRALPTWLVATYAGGETNVPGSVTLTVASTGKISGKWISEGLTWTLSATGFAATDGAEYAATVTAKSGKLAESLEVLFAAEEVDDADIGTVVAYGGDERLFSARGANWKAEPWKSLAAKMKSRTFRADDASAGVTLSGKVGSNGAVTVAGQFDVGAARPYAASASGTLQPLGEDRFELFVYYPPKTAKGFAGLAIRLVLGWDGTQFEVEEF